MQLLTLYILLHLYGLSFIFFFFSCNVVLLYLHSFPTRRSSDLITTLISDKSRVYKGGSWNDRAYWLTPSARRYLEEDRSEEHTSELQSHSDLVCRLLLEKKNKIKIFRL